MKEIKSCVLQFVEESDMADVAALHCAGLTESELISVLSFKYGLENIFHVAALYNHIPVIFSKSKNIIMRSLEAQNSGLSDSSLNFPFVKLHLDTWLTFVF